MRIVALIVGISYIAYRSFTTLVVLPFAGGVWNGANLLELGAIIAALITLWLLQERRRASALLTAAVVLVAGATFAAIASVSEHGLWSSEYFRWFVLPELAFFSSIALWFFTAARSLHVGTREEVDRAGQTVTAASSKTGL